jgi:rhodanese-related sulfurtransferase
MSVWPDLFGPKPGDYAGDVTPTEAWRILSENQNAVLVDVRTQAEWGFVGIPDLSIIGKNIILQEWQKFPTMERQVEFESQVMQQLEDVNLDKTSPVFFLCRSGVRSQGAAISLSAAGYESCYNVKDGFEGPKDHAGHRGSIAGWKASELPWQQQ